MLCDRTILLYGYNRGTYMRAGQRIHVPGLGDMCMDEISELDDPCPLPSRDKDKNKRRTLKAADKTIYAPMSDVSGILFDKDATYIEIPDKHIVFSKPSMLFPTGVSAGDVSEAEHIRRAREAVMDAQSGHTAALSEGVALVKHLQDTDMAVDSELHHATLQLFSGGRNVTSAQYDASNREREKTSREREDTTDATSEEPDDELQDEDEDGDEQEDEEEEGGGEADEGEEEEESSSGGSDDEEEEDSSEGEVEEGAPRRLSPSPSHEETYRHRISKMASS